MTCVCFRLCFLQGSKVIFHINAFFSRHAITEITENLQQHRWQVTFVVFISLSSTSSLTPSNFTSSLCPYCLPVPFSLSYQHILRFSICLAFLALLPEHLMCCPSDVLILILSIHITAKENLKIFTSCLASSFFSYHYIILCSAFILSIFLTEAAAILNTPILCCVATLSPTTNLQSSHSDYIIYKICGSPACSCFCHTITSPWTLSRFLGNSASLLVAHTSI